MATSIENVVVFGDSIARGFGVPNRRSWVKMLAEHYYDMNERSPHAVFVDLSYPGDGSVRLQQRVETELPNRVRSGRRHLSIVALGAQDMFERVSIDGLPDRFSHPTPARLMRNMIPTARKLGKYGMTLLLGPTACRADLAGLYGHSHLAGKDSGIVRSLGTLSKALYESFDVAASPMPQENFFTYVDLLHDSATDPAFTLGRDGIHPDAQGQQWIYNQIVPHFDRLVHRPLPSCANAYRQASP
jgi:lysophospholipase L1-like esterase